jgi:hypothetical protein
MRCERNVIDDACRVRRPCRGGFYFCVVFRGLRFVADSLALFADSLTPG